MPASATHPTLIRYFEPMTLGQLGIHTHQMIFSCHYQPTALPKTYQERWLNKLPIIGKHTSQQWLDVDLHCLVYDKDEQLLEKICYRKLRSQNDAIRHQGDDFTGLSQDGTATNEERISIRLHDLPDDVYRLVLCADTYAHKPLAKALSGQLRLSTHDGHLIHDISLDGLPPTCTTLHAWQLERQAGDWHISALMIDVQNGMLNRLI